MISLGGLVNQKAFGKFEMGKVISNPFATAFIKEAEGEDHEVSMGQNQLDTIIKMATELKAKMGENEKEIPAWIQDHISKAENYISQAAGNYHEYGKNESIKEARGLPKMYVKYMAVQKKVNELEAKQKEMATKYFAEKELNKKAKMLQDLKKGTEQLASYRRNLAAIEDKYITGLYADAEYEGE